MTDKEGIGEKLRRMVYKLGAEAKRATGLAQVKMQLNRLQGELAEREGTLGRKLSQLKRRGVVKDRFILEALKEEFASLDECEGRIKAALDEVHDLAVIEPVIKDQIAQNQTTGEEEGKSDLNSFEVS